ncbi:SRPBCC family protein [Pedobacter frigidisoli]|uniref:SRPBCC family protein n=1 Tax=Pedobacter frigidisoli TaxID=2530455 RepID=UPI001CEC7AAE|nr:SRPBCC family protein [Pedobacter frigidisoli]
MTVQAPREKVYAFWRDLSNLPKFMSHISSILETSPEHSSWKASTPGNLLELKWNAEITHEEEGKYIV